MDGRRGGAAGDVKVSVNLSPVDVGMIDVLRGSGWHSTRSDLVRIALHRYFHDHQQQIDRLLGRRAITVGVEEYDRARLEQTIAEGKRVSGAILGTLVIGDDVSPDLAEEAFGEIEVFGVARMTDAVREVLGARVTASARR